jgi:hypothetical protein
LLGLLGLPSLAGRAALAQSATPSIRSRPLRGRWGASCARAWSGLKKHKPDDANAKIKLVFFFLIIKRRKKKTQK